MHRWVVIAFIFPVKGVHYTKQSAEQRTRLTRSGQQPEMLFAQADNQAVQSGLPEIISKKTH